MKRGQKEVEKDVKVAHKHTSLGTRRLIHEEAFYGGSSF